MIKENIELGFLAAQFMVIIWFIQGCVLIYVSRKRRMYMLDRYYSDDRASEGGIKLEPLQPPIL